MKLSYLKAFLIIFLLLMASGQLSATTIWATGVDQTSGWFDAEKDSENTDDDELCWAAAGANILAWSGWDAGYADEDAIFDYLESQTHDAGGWPSWAWNFWFDGTKLGRHFTDSAHTGFYSTEEYNSALVQEWDNSDLDNALDLASDWLQDDYGVGLAVYGSCYHAITLWGIELDDEGDYAGIWITDSDNEKYGPDPRLNTLDYYDVYFGSDNLWHLAGMCSNPAIYEMEGLRQYVPEPGSAILLGFGLLTFLMAGRKKKY